MVTLNPQPLDPTHQRKLRILAVQRRKVGPHPEPQLLTPHVHPPAPVSLI